MAEVAWTTASITSLAVDAVVTAANAALAGGGGVDGAIHRAAGPELLQACRALGGCPTGEARITPGFRLRARFVIHAVGPVWQGGEAQEAQLLASAYRASCALADAHGCARIAFPAISCGIYGYPIPAAMATAVATLRAWSAALPERILLVGFDPAVAEALRALLGPPVPG